MAYADDLTMLSSGKFEGNICQRMQTTLRTNKKWCTGHAVSAIPRKMEMAVFTRKR